MDKKAEKVGIVGIALIAGVLLLVMQSGALKSLFPQATQGTGSTGSGSGVPESQKFEVVGAPCTQGTSLKSVILRRYTDVEQTAYNTTIYQNGVSAGTIADGSTITVQSGANGDNLDIYPAFDRSSTFYATHLRGTVGTCKASATIGDPDFKAVPASEDLGESVKLGTPLVFSDKPHKVLQRDTNGNANWFSIVNDGQATQNTGRNGNNLTIGTGGSGSVTITFRPGYNTAIGPNGNVLACQYPQAVYDSVAPLSVTYAGTVLEETGTKPSTQNYPLIGSNNTVKAFAFPGIDGRATPSVEIKMTLRASSNNDPAGNLDRVNCTIFDSEYYTRQKDGKVVLDIENRDNNNNLGLGGTGVNVVANPDPSFEIGV